ncbi:hypothetical protein AArcSl_2553 [Halalkaliarchaeum desulfuricum]|uniref:TIGR04206 family protein n=1 Tax=Halalkaliarchaeum desulfuricum TaxID=2055893 RepID=A0A343TM51_9EURY|nr:hypothetical protein [Halalkaliarchaeum desulfuricum]AUX10173.1 hypothetical protein AArcSl_2553 [Halalkaliarchaeum desulfuricum]
MWVRSEYAGELAVVSAWLAVFIPWNVALSERVFDGRFLAVRFPLFEVQYGWGFAIPELNGLGIQSVPAAIRLQAGESVAVAYQLWGVAAIVVLAAAAVAGVYYLREAAVESGPVDPVRLIGALLVLAGVLFVGAAYLRYSLGIPEYPIPLGTVILLVLGVVLLRVDRRN